MPGELGPSINVGIPYGLNLNYPIEVFVRSLDRSIAVPTGADSNGVLRLIFPAGGNNTQPVSISSLSAGNALIDLSGPTGLTSSNMLCIHVPSPRCTLDLRSSPPGAGMISMDPLPDANGQYAAGTVVTLTARPEPAYSFISWSGSVDSTNNPLSLTVESDLDVLANFTDWTLQEELLFSDNFSVLGQRNDVSYIGQIKRQRGSVAPLTYLDTSGPESQVGNPTAPGRLYLRPSSGWVEVSPCHNFIEADRWAIEFDVNAGTDDEVGTATGGAAVVLSSRQNPDPEDFRGVAILFWNDGRIEVLSGSRSVYSGDGGYPGGVPRDNLHVRVGITKGGWAARTGVTIGLMVNGIRLRIGDEQGYNYYRATDLTAHYITLGGFATYGRTWRHTFDNLAVWALNCIQCSTNQATLLAGEVSDPLSLIIPRALNSAHPVEVAIRSLDPTVAVPLGADSNGVLQLVFPTLGANARLFSIQGVQPGTTAFDVSGPAGTCAFGITNVMVIPQRYTLVTEASPRDAGTATVSPLPDLDGMYVAGTVVTLTAVPTNNTPFLRWDEDAVGTNQQITVTMGGNRFVRAVFVTPADLQSTNIGLSPAIGSTIRTNGVDFQIMAGGTGVGGFADDFRYVFEQRWGDFDAVVRLESLDASSLLSQAGLMVRQSLDPASTYFGVLSTRLEGGNALYVQQRWFAGGPSTAWAARKEVGYPLWIRLRRQGGSVSGFAALDGTNWTLLAALEMDLQDPIHLGLATSAGTSQANATAIYSDYRVLTVPVPLVTVTARDSVALEGG